jgi:haloacetate dehalogenase
MSFFDGFTLEHVDVGTATLRVRSGGSGPCVLLLHGHPRTHTTWYRVAPLLARAGFTVVCPDLPGYGESRRVVGDFSKKAMAGDLAALMERFGGAFAVVGHDRGSYVAHRMAVEGHAERLAVLDCVPITEHLERCDDRFAAAWWHWFFFAQTEKPAEAIINRDPDAWYRADPAAMGPENHADWWRAVHTPEVVYAMVGDYRAGLNVDRFDEAADRAAGRFVTCPTLVGWSERDDMEELYGDPLAIWRAWATGPLSAATIDSGHHMAEEAPEALAAALLAFLR